MYRDVPEGVPLIWSDGALTDRFLNGLISIGVLDGKRPLVRDHQHNTVMRADQLYLYHADDDNFPHMQITEFAYMNDLIVEGMTKKYGKRDNSQRKKITILHRLGAVSRVVSNHQEVLNKLKEEFPNHDVSDFVINESMLSDFIGNVAKVFFDSDIIEPTNFPVDYMCFSRNLRLNYSTVIGSGNIGANLQVPVSEVVDTVKFYL